MKGQTQENETAVALEIPSIAADLGYVDENLEGLISELEERLSSVLSDPKLKEEKDKMPPEEKRTHLGRKLHDTKLGFVKSFERLEDLKNRLEV